MSTATHTFTAPLGDWDGTAASWVLVTVPVEASESIRAMPRPPRRGFGSLRVTATIGTSTWPTSIFPDSKSGCYVLFVKKAVRKAEGIDVGHDVEVTVEILE